MMLPLTVRLDRWASTLRNADDPLTDDERMELSTLLTEAANSLGGVVLTAAQWREIKDAMGPACGEILEDMGLEE